MAKLLVLGAGMVGSAMARDLDTNHEVTLADLSESNLEKVNSIAPGITTRTLDVSAGGDMEELAKDFDLVVLAVPGFLGYRTLERLIRAGKNVVDISFFPEDALALDALAKENEVTAIVDCGVAPGMDNIILGHYNEILSIEEFECMVGGLPKKPKPPFNYKAPFSPVDVIEEYTRPARFVKDGKVVTMPALSDIREESFEKLGKLQSFNSDGLRSLLQTMSHIPNMIEKTLRYPGHAEQMQLLSDAGLFSEETRRVSGNDLRPIDLTSSLLFDHWKLGEEEEELTIMRVRIRGQQNGEEVHFQYDLYDEYDPVTGVSSMSRTTGYTATAAVNLFLEGKFQDQGVFPPELVGAKNGALDYFMNYLEQRGVKYHKKQL